MTYFFEGLDGITKLQRSNPAIDAITTAMSTPDGVRIVIALAAIKNPRLRRGIAQILAEIIKK